MLTLGQMVLRLVVAFALGALMGIERERIGKEAGLRTAMLVSGGAALFTLASLLFPEAVTELPTNWGALPDRIAANIVVGIGFLGAGIIIQTGNHVRGLTTAALIWFAAAVGIIVGMGYFAFGAVAAVSVTILLYVLRDWGIKEKIAPKDHKKDSS